MQTIPLGSFAVKRNRQGGESEQGQGIEGVYLVLLLFLFLTGDINRALLLIRMLQ